MTDLYRDPTAYDIMYGELQCNRHVLWERWWAVLNCTKDAIWRSRNILAFKKFAMAPMSVAKLAVSIARDYILLDKTKFNDMDVKEHWKVGESGLVYDLLKDVI